MKRRILTFSVLVAMSLPGCANRQVLGVPYALGTVATVAGVVMLADVVMNPTRCETVMPGEEDLDPWCFGAVADNYARMAPPMLSVTSGLVVIAGTVLVHWYSIWRQHRGTTVAADTKN